MNTSLETHDAFEPIDFNNEIPPEVIRKNLDELSAEVEEDLGPELEDMTEAELDQAVDDIQDGTREFLEVQMQSENPEVAARAKFQHEVLEDMDKFLSNVGPLIETEQFDKAETQTQDFLQAQLEKLEAMDLDSMYVNNAIEEMRQFIDSYGNMMEQRVLSGREGWALVSTGIDLVPYVGGAKMMVEGLVGKDLVGKKMTAGQRVMHSAEGAVWVVVDVAATAVAAATAPAGGAGGAVVEGVKFGAQAGKAAKFIKRGGAAVRAVTKGPKGRKAAKAMYNAGSFVAKHPKLSEATGKLIAKGVDKRKPGKLDLGVQAVKAVVERQSHKAILAEIKRERHELMETLANTFDSKTT